MKNILYKSYIRLKKRLNNFIYINIYSFITPRSFDKKNTLLSF